MIPRQTLVWRLLTLLPLLFVLTVTMPAVGAAQTAVTAADIEQIENRIDRADRAIVQLEQRDAVLASELERDLNDARDEAIYLKVKLRKRESIARNDVRELRDRVDSIHTRAVERRSTTSTDRGSTTPDTRRSTGRRSSTLSEIPIGTEFDVRLQTALNSDTAQVEDRFDATTLVDLRDGDAVLVPAGSIMSGTVDEVTKAGRIDRKGRLMVSFNRIRVGSRSYPIRATVTQALESEGIKGEVGKIGAGATIGGILGAIIGGAKGAAIGVLIGGGGVTAATDGEDVELPAGTVLRVRLDEPLTLD